MAGRTGSADCRSRFKTRSYARAKFTAAARAIGCFTLLPERFVACRGIGGARYSAWHRQNKRVARSREIEENFGSLGAVTMSEEIQDDWLDRKLQEAVPYIEDDGFTARVLRQLPPPLRRMEFLRSFILVAMSALASALTYVLSDGGRFILVEMFRLTTIPTVWVVAFALASGILVMVGGIFAAMYKTDQIQS